MNVALELAHRKLLGGGILNFERKKRISRNLAIFLVSALALVMSTLALAAPGGRPVVNVSGHISANTTWKGTTTYVVTGDTTVDTDTVLTIEPGAIIKFRPAVGTTRAFIIRGTINAAGTSTNSIIFTSNLDDSVGGDTNGDGSATSPTPGDWSGFRLQTGCTVNLSGTTIKYGSTGISHYAPTGHFDDPAYFPRELSIKNSEISICGNGIYVRGIYEATVKDCVIKGNRGFGMMVVTCNKPDFENNRVTNNGTPGTNSKAVEICPNALPTFKGNILSGNTQNAVWVWNTARSPSHMPTPYSHTGGDVTLYGNTVYVLYGTVWASKDTIFTIEPGAIVKGQPGALVVQGELFAEGTFAKPIAFTSFLDSTYGGNTSGSTATPAKGDWSGIYFDPGATGMIENAIIKYATYGINANDANVLITGNSIMGNSAGIQNSETGPVVMAENNWWGAANGPYPYGVGDSISYKADTNGNRTYFVDADPWLSSDPFTGKGEKNTTTPTTIPSGSGSTGGGGNGSDISDGSGWSGDSGRIDDGSGDGFSGTPTTLAVTKGEVIFSDIPSDAWYGSFVSTLVLKGVIGGYEDGTFRPGNSITRAEFAKMVCFAKDWTLENPSKASFADIRRSHWAFEYVETAKAHGTLTGYPDGLFNPGRTITRAEIAAIIARTLSLAPRSSDLTDSAQHWAAGFVGACVKTGIITGYPDKTFRPDNTATRAEAAKMISSMLK